MTFQVHRSIVSLLAIIFPLSVHAAPPLDSTFFESKVKPILKEHCFDCHGEGEQKNKLRLDTALGVLRGGESGEPLFVRGASADSYIIKRVTSGNAKEAMPPGGGRLTAEQVGVLAVLI